MQGTDVNNYRNNEVLSTGVAPIQALSAQAVSLSYAPNVMIGNLGFNQSQVIISMQLLRLICLWYKE